MRRSQRPKASAAAAGIAASAMSVRTRTASARSNVVEAVLDEAGADPIRQHGGLVAGLGQRRGVRGQGRAIRVEVGGDQVELRVEVAETGRHLLEEAGGSGERRRAEQLERTQLGPNRLEIRPQATNGLGSLANRRRRPFERARERSLPASLRRGGCRRCDRGSASSGRPRPRPSRRPRTTRPSAQTRAPRPRAAATSAIDPVGEQAVAQLAQRMAEFRPGRDRVHRARIDRAGCQPWDAATPDPANRVTAVPSPRRNRPATSIGT